MVGESTATASGCAQMTNETGPHTIDLGDDHILTFVEYKGDTRTGANIEHKTALGEPCIGWISFEGSAWSLSFKEPIPKWKVIQPDPLTLSPSILCRVCGDHGFVQNGKWVRA